MNRLSLMTTIAIAAVLPSQLHARAPEKPRLIVAISVDQFSADLFAEYRQLYMKGMRRLAEGAVFPSGYQSHAATETCPGHSTILTGSHPARTGIIANFWYDLSSPRASKLVYCAEDPAIARDATGGYTVSPAQLKAPTLGDRMKAADPASRVVAVAGKDRAAVMMGGHRTDQMWFWGGKSYVTLADRTGPAPATVGRINAQVAAILARPGRATLPAQCAHYSAPVPLGNGQQVGMLTERKAGDASLFRATAAFDAATTDLAIGLLDELKLGQGPSTDLLTIGLSATDYVGHIFGTEGAEMCARMFGLDADIGRILSALDARKIDYVVVLTADHGGHDLPERNVARGFAGAQRVARDLSTDAIGKAVADTLQLGIAEPLFYSDGPFGDWYLSRKVPAEMRARAIALARSKLLAHPQVATVFSADELRRMPNPAPPVEEWTLAERARASFDPERSGDLVVLLKPHVTPIADPAMGAVATHGSPWGYDRRVPILFYRPGMTGFEQPLSVETVDILPTLAALIGLDIAGEEIDGRCLDLDPGPAGSCGR